VQNADSSTLLHDPDAALQSGPSEKTRGHAAASLLRFARPNLKIDFNKIIDAECPAIIAIWAGSRGQRKERLNPI
jgi:hypothetical protein